MSDPIEEWRPVVGWEEFYQVSNLGSVRSLDRWAAYRDGRKARFFPGRARKTFLVRGYPHLMLKHEGKYKNFYVHTLVCKAFRGPRPAPDYEVRHLNGDPTDNRIVNLVWGTKSENAQDSIRHGTNKQLNRTHCIRGHEFNEENLYRHGTTRLCRPCRLERNARKRGAA